MATVRVDILVLTYPELGTRYLKSSGAATILTKRAAALPLIAAQIKK